MEVNRLPTTTGKCLEPSPVNKVYLFYSTPLKFERNFSFKFFLLYIYISQSICLALFQVIIMSLVIVENTLYLIQSDDPILKLQGARDIRRLTKSSLRYRRYFSDAIKPLVHMLRDSESFEYNEAAILALLNLSVKDEEYVYYTNYN